MRGEGWESYPVGNKQMQRWKLTADLDRHWDPPSLQEGGSNLRSSPAPGAVLQTGEHRPATPPHWHPACQGVGDSQPKNRLSSALALPSLCPWGTGLAVQWKTTRKAAEGAGQYFWRWRSGTQCMGPHLTSCFLERAFSTMFSTGAATRVHREPCAGTAWSRAARPGCPQGVCPCLTHSQSGCGAAEAGFHCVKSTDPTMDNPIRGSSC